MIGEMNNGMDLLFRSTGVSGRWDGQGNLQALGQAVTRAWGLLHSR